MRLCVKANTELPRGHSSLINVRCFRTGECELERVTEAVNPLSMSIIIIKETNGLKKRQNTPLRWKTLENDEKVKETKKNANVIL